MVKLKHIIVVAFIILFVWLNLTTYNSLMTESKYWVEIASITFIMDIVTISTIAMVYGDEIWSYEFNVRHYIIKIKNLLINLK